MANIDSHDATVRLSDDDDRSSDTLLGKENHIWTPLGEKKRSGRSLSWLMVGTALSAVVGLLSATLIVYIFIHTRNIEASMVREVNLGDCGQSHTVEEARAMGCVFDPMSWVWLRPECYDAELVDNFMNRTDWSWHTKPTLDAESMVPMEEVYRGDHPTLFTSKMYHTVHCAYMMKRMYRALAQQRPIDDYALASAHTNHCQMVMLDQYFHEDTQCTAEMVCPTWVRATWTSCVQI